MHSAQEDPFVCFLFVLPFFFFFFFEEFNEIDPGGQEVNERLEAPFTTKGKLAQT